MVAVYDQMLVFVAQPDGNGLGKAAQGDEFGALNPAAVPLVVFAAVNQAHRLRTIAQLFELFDTDFGGLNCRAHGTTRTGVPRVTLL